MATGYNKRRLIPSVYDRLLGEELPSETSLEIDRVRHVRRLKAALKRDLENLLNTRCRCGGYPREFSELEMSLVNYGIPDFTGSNAGSVEQRTAFLQIIKEAIERFEPRLRHVILTPVEEDGAPLQRVLQFRVEAMLVTEEEEEPVSFVSTMEPASGSYRLDKD